MLGEDTPTMGTTTPFEDAVVTEIALMVSRGEDLPLEGLPSWP